MAIRVNNFNEIWGILFVCVFKHQTNDDEKLIFAKKINIFSEPILRDARNTYYNIRIQSESTLSSLSPHTTCKMDTTSEKGDNN